MFKTSLMATLLLGGLLSTPALSQDHSTMDHGTMDHGAAAAESKDMAMEAAMGKPKGDTGPASTAFAEANARMHGAMDITYTGNADIDFVRGMIAHHQGAIDMARIELEHGKDATLRALAEEIIAAQEAEIATMKDWLSKNGG